MAPDEKEILEENIEMPEILSETDDIQVDSEPNSPESNLEIEVQTLKEKYIRLLAEFDNFKKRSTKEKQDLAKFGTQDLLQSLLPVLDDFERAQKHNDPQGLTIVNSKLLQILKAKGLVEMLSTETVFDPEQHDAITELEVSEDKKGFVIDTVEKGYYLGEKIIRHAKVIVGK